MYTSIRAELQKARRRHDLIVCLLVPVMALLWCQSAAPTGADELASAYSALFYSLPIINTILMPLAMAILASRLWDVEVKGCTPKLLYTLQSRRSLFAAKAVLGLAEIFLIVTLEAAGGPADRALAALHAALPRRRPGYLSLGLHLCRGLHDFFL